MNVEIGTYHGGEYLLHMLVSPDDYKECPAMLADEFEGFRVVWIPVRDFKPLNDTGRSLEGSWVSEDGYYEFELERTDSGLIVSGRIGGTDSEFHIQYPTLNEQFVLFSAYDPLRNLTTSHTFRLIDGDVAEDDLTYPCRFNRRY